jgi:DNA-binding LytR/AlgR family response regulator
VVSDDVRVIMCVAFDHRAPAAEVDQFKDCLLNCSYVLHAVELTGSFDLMVEAKVASLAEYNERMEGLKAAVSHLVSRYEANFICRRFVRDSGQDHAIWVPCQDGKVRVDHDRIDKVVAEGDYMRLHCGDVSHLVHMTMHALRDVLGEEFVLLHRSVLTRCDFIDRLIHRDNKWNARLKDGSQVMIAKSHVVEVMERLHIASSKTQSDSSNGDQVVEQSAQEPSKSTSNVQDRPLVMPQPSS